MFQEQLYYYTPVSLCISRGENNNSIRSLEHVLSFIEFAVGKETSRSFETKNLIYVSHILFIISWVDYLDKRNITYMNHHFISYVYKPAKTNV